MSYRTYRSPAQALALALAACDPSSDLGDPPPVALRRLTRFEYDATARDLVGQDLGLARDFPADAHAHGFDGIAEAQVLSPLQLQLYQLAAVDLAAAALAAPDLTGDLLACAPHDPECRRAGLRPALAQIWRRPPTAPELDRYAALVDRALEAGAAPPEALALALEAAFLSPHFLFRPERDPPGPGAHSLAPHELAVRLSYFLWSSAPDDELRALADRGDLDDDAALAAQVRRMLADPRAARFIDAFFGQWLVFRGLDDVFRDAHRYPAFDEPLRAAMAAAIRGRIAPFLRGGRDLRDLLRDPVGLVDPHLAGIYRMPAPAAPGLVPLDLRDRERRGVLTEPALLTVLAHPFATSPTRRGRFILESILCEPPAPPPADAAVSPPEAAAPTARERLAQHRADPACAGCHAALDPLGLAFERYDAIGAWRGSEAGALIDPAGDLPGLGPFEGAPDLALRLADDPRVPRCVAQHLLTFALGRAPLPADAPVLDALVARLEESGYDLVELLVAVVQSDPFRRRTPQDPAP